MKLTHILHLSEFHHTLEHLRQIKSQLKDKQTNKTCRIESRM